MARAWAWIASQTPQVQVQNKPTKGAVAFQVAAQTPQVYISLIKIESDQNQK
jgi:hypothetical protein